jgi:hypothetical protein
MVSCAHIDRSNRGSSVFGIFSDLAIGAPNSEHVFVYKTYPMVLVSSSIVFDEESKKPDVKSFDMTACLQITLPARKSGVEIGKIENYMLVL